MQSMTSPTPTPRRAVLWQIPPDLAARRKRSGADRHDEVWEGVVHMGPEPTNRHQDVAGAMFGWIQRHWQRRRRGKVFYQCNVARPGIPDWREDYRAPDLVLLKPPRFDRDADSRFDGGPDVVVEVYTPGDESYDKLPFYFAIGVDEVWIVHRDTLAQELFARGESGFVRARPADGWLRSAATGIALRPCEANRLALRLDDDVTTDAVVPEDW